MSDHIHTVDWMAVVDDAIKRARPDWDEYGLNLAQAVALRADCTRRKVGAVLMGADRSIISVGYNGGPSKGPSCLAGQCPRGRMTHEELPSNSAYDTGGGTCVALHAEWNVLLRTAWYQFEGATLYVTEEPCHICKTLIAGTKIVRVVTPITDARLSHAGTFNWWAPNGHQH